MILGNQMQDNRISAIAGLCLFGCPSFDCVLHVSEKKPGAFRNLISKPRRRDAADPEVQSSEPMCAAPWRPGMVDL